MARLSVAILVLVVAEAGAAPRRDYFKKWTIRHNKQYENDEEYERRFVVWSSNHALVDAHNANAAKGLKSFWMKMSAVADLTMEEYRSQMLGLQRPAQLSSRSIFTRAGGAPDSWDWRPTGIVTPVKNQAQCGSCWSFSAVAAMEGAFNLKSNGTVPNDCKQFSCGPDKKPCCSFSEQELVDCVNGGAQTCNTGGNPSDGVDYIANSMQGKASTETEYPYTSGGGVSKGVCLKAKQTDGVATGITGFSSITEGDEDALKEATYTKSIISIGIDASHQSFQMYGGGVYIEPACSSTQLDHGVSIVGYGTDGPSPGPSPPGPGPSPSPGPSPPGPVDCIENEDESSCQAEEGCNWCTSLGGWCSNTPCLGLGQSSTALASQKAGSGDYWTVRNSWGASWGLDGYILMARNRDNQCGVATDAIFADVGAVRASEIVV